MNALELKEKYDKMSKRDLIKEIIQLDIFVQKVGGIAGESELFGEMGLARSIQRDSTIAEITYQQAKNAVLLFDNDYIGQNRIGLWNSCLCESLSINETNK